MAQPNRAAVELPNDESSSQTPRFTLFPELPKELRLLIWKEAMPGPRLVFIEQRPLKTTIGDWEDNREGEDWPPYGPGKEGEILWARDWVRDALSSNDEYRQSNTMGIACKTQIPNVFLACKETYCLARKMYTCVFACDNSIPKTYFDFEEDTLCLDLKNFHDYWWPGNDTEHTGQDIQLKDWNGFRKEDTEHLQKVKRLAVRVQSVIGRTYNCFDALASARLLRVFKGVMELSFVLRSTKVARVDEQSSDLALMDPIWDVDEALSLYRDYTVMIDEIYGECGRVEMPEGVRVISPRFSRKDLKKHQQRDKYWVLPEIKEVIMVDRETKEEYEEAKKACKEVVDQLIGDESCDEEEPSDEETSDSE